MKIKASTRVVFVFKNFVIKIPVSLRGYLQCKQEFLIWNKYKNLNVLGELYWYKYGIVCMKRYPIANSVPEYTIKSIKSLIPEMDISRCDLNVRQNWGMDGVNHILIDYGINEEISKMYN